MLDEMKQKARPLKGKGRNRMLEFDDVMKMAMVKIISSGVCVCEL